MVDYITKLETKSVDSLLAEIECKREAKQFNLCPPYQRNVVWSESKQSAFINSVMLGIIPNSVVFNKIESGWECIDGKQRITSLLKFKQNKIPVYLDGMSVFYNKICCQCQCKCKCRTLTKAERRKFLDRSIPVAFYSDINYECQVDIFQRIQNGVVLSSGEKAASIFDDVRIAKKFNTLSTNSESCFQKFCKISRKEHNVYLLCLMYMIDLNELRYSSKSARQSYLNQLSYEQFKISEKKLLTLIETCFSDKLLNHKSIKKMNNNVLLVTAYTIYTEFISNQTLSDTDYKHLRTAISVTWRDWNVVKNKSRSKTSLAVLQDIKKKFLANYKKIKKLDIVIEDESDSDDELDSSSSESPPPIERKRKRRRRPKDLMF